MELTKAQLSDLLNRPGTLWLVDIDLSGANLAGAGLGGANLEGVKNMTAILPGQQALILGPMEPDSALKERIKVYQFDGIAALRATLLPQET